MSYQQRRRKPTTQRAKRGATTQRSKPQSFKRGGRQRGPSLANKLSGFLLGTNKIIRDLNAANKGTLGDRVVRRVGGKAAGRGLGSLSDFFKK